MLLAALRRSHVATACDHIRLVFIREKLLGIEEYIHAQDRHDHLITLSLIHYQFEVIRPFLDGNGRIGRIINILYLVLKGLIDLPVLYLSAIQTKFPTTVTHKRHTKIHCDI